MRVFGTIMTILILAGIFGCTIARSRIPIRRELIHGQSKLSNIPDLAASETLRAIVENLDVSLRRKCEENGRPTAYDAFRRELLSLPDCIDSALNIQRLEAHRQHSLHFREWRTFFEEYCPKVPAAKLCFSHIIDSIQPCLTSEEEKEVEIFDGVTNSILEFLCQNNGSNTAYFVAIGGVECMASKHQALRVCVMEALHSYPRPGERQKFPSFELTPEECADLEKVRTCTSRVMNTCDNPRVANVVESLFDFYQKERSCRVIPEEPTASTTATWIPMTTPQELVPGEEETPGNFIKRQCDKNGGPTAYETFEESAQLVLNVYGLVANSSQIVTEISNALPGEEMVNVFKKYCRRAPILKGLVKYAGDSMKHCLGPEERNRIDILYKIKSSMLEFFCHNEGERISTFVASGGIGCLGFEGRALMNCVSQSFGSYSPNTFSVGAPALGLENLEVPFVQAAKFCADVEKFRDCSIELLGQCGDRTTNLNLLNTVVDLISKEIPCGNSLEETEPPTPEISNSTVAPEGFPSTEATPQTLSDLDNITGLNDIRTMRTVSNQAFIQHLTAKCRPDYRPTKFAVAEVIAYYLSESIQLMLKNLERIHFQSVHAAEREILDIVFKKFCQKVSTVEERTQLVAESVQTNCLYLIDQKKMNFLYNTASAFQEFICHNEGERLTRFTASGGIECWASMKRSIESCVVESFPNFVASNTSYVPFGGFINACQHYSQAAKNCFVSTLEDCRDPNPANIIESLIDYVIREVPCIDMLNP